MTKLMTIAAGCLAASLSWGKSFSIDLRRPVTRNVVRAMAKFTAAPTAMGDSAFIRKVNLDAGAADVGMVAVGDELEFTLFDDVTVTLTLKKQMPSPLGGDVFLAEASGYAGIKSAVVLRTADGLTVDIHDHRRTKMYKVVSTAVGVSVQEMEARGGKCGCDALSPPKSSNASSQTMVHKSQNVVAETAANSDGTCVDILVAYDGNAATWANDNGGGLTNFAQMAVQRMNAALVNNGLDGHFRFRLVGIQKVDVASTDLDATLDDATYGTGGWAAVKSKRDEVGADIVTVLVDTGSAYGTTGIGWSLDTLDSNWFSQYAYNVCAIRSVAQSHTMTHEVGHNMGCGHSDIQPSDPGPQLYEYSSGYYFTAHNEAYHTIMAYDTEGPGGNEVPYFSSPDHTYMGVAVGDAKHDNARTLLNTFETVSQWRPAIGDEIVGDDTDDEPPPVDMSSGELDSSFAKAQTVTCVLKDSDGIIAGIVQLKAGKKSKKEVVKISATATLLNGKKVTAKAISMAIGGPLERVLSFKSPIGEMTFKMAEDGKFSLYGNNYAARAAERIGGALDTDELSFSVDIDNIPYLGSGLELVDDALPGDVPVRVTNGGKKWTLPKSPTLKYKKFRKDGETWYELVGLDDEKKPNVSGLKLTYTANTGMFKGSFKLYATNEASTPKGKSPKLTKYTANVVGVVVDGVGVGLATCSKPAASWPVMVK